MPESLLDAAAVDEMVPWLHRTGRVFAVLDRPRAQSLPLATRACARALTVAWRARQ